MAREHHAMLEFAHMNVQFSDISRGFTHEMVRHRLASFAQESTRYVDESDLHVVVPPHKDELGGLGEIVKCDDMEDFEMTFKDMLGTSQLHYKMLRKNGWKPEDARQVLPIATTSQIVVGANIREWRKIFELRTSEYAHWEIRSVMVNLLKWCKENIPLVFDDFLIYENNEKEYGHRVLPRLTLIKELSMYNKSVDDKDKMNVL